MNQPLPLRLLFTAAIAAAFPAVATAQQADDAILQTVKVTAARASGFVPSTVEAGSFRGADIMDVPSTVNVITREVLELQAATGLYDAVRNTAGVTRQQNGGETWDQLVIRGIAVENRTNYRLNGALPIMNFGQVSLEDKERVEVLKGATALYYGFTSPAGVVNFVTKRAGATPVTSLGMRVDQNGTAVANIDVGRRFGAQQQVGVRINAAGGTQGSYLDGVGDGNRGFVSAALDWRVNSRLRLAADLEYDRRRVTEQVGVNLPTAVNGVITLPATVDPKRLVGPDWAKFRTESKNLLLRADYALSDQWVLTLEGGRAETARDRALPIFRFTNNAAIATGAGRITGNLQHSELDSSMLRAELAGVFRTGAIQHDVTLGANRTDKGQDPIYQATYTIAAQNLYRPTPIGSYTVSAYPTTPSTAGLETRDTGIYAIDRLTLSPQWQAIAGVRSVQYRSDQGANHYDVSKTTPLAALIYKHTDNLSFYVSGSQGLEEGETAPTGSANANERLAPGVSHQQEIGARWRIPGNGAGSSGGSGSNGSNGGLLLQASVFDIDRPGYYTNAANVYTADGEQHFRGLELSAQGQLTRQLSWQGSAQFIDPEFRNIGAAYNGKLPENASRRTASAFLSYELEALPGLSFNGGAFYTGERPVNDLNQAMLGGVTVFSAGSRYVTSVLGRRTSFQLNVENAGGKQYWAGAGTRLSSGMPRLIKLGVKVDL